MRRAGPLFLSLMAGVALLAQPVAAAGPAPVPQARHDETLAIWKKMVSIPSVHGRGQMRVMADYVADLLRKAGFAAEDIVIEGEGDDISLAARYRGTDKAKKALLLSGHMDVVEAKPEDWTRDPFTPVEENGYLFGRGALDMKFGDAMLVSTLVQLKAEGYKPKRDILLLLSGDEETAMLTTQRLAKKYAAEGELLLNADAGGGLLDDKGQPVAYYVQGGEKTYADYEIAVTDPGGHSSRPGATNAIYSLARAIDRIAAYRFPAQLNELTRAYWTATAKQVGGETGAAMLRFVADPTDAKALATLRAMPEYVGATGTTCVATMLSGGHARNALPQRAAVGVNCRIFPGVSIESVRAKLAELVADPKVTVTTLDAPLASDASPLRPDLMKAVRKAVDLSYPGLTIVPQMSAGATDSFYFRALGVPSYGVGGMFMKPDDDFSHGLNERAPIASIDPALRLTKSLIVDMSK
jgi:acetylornithine deacetylase/succinyl-diaminopimelate desuccinylase-like protein